MEIGRHQKVNKLSLAILAVLNLHAGAPAYSQACSDTACPPSHRYQLACYTSNIEPTFFHSANRESTYEQHLTGVAYKDGRDLSFTPYELINSHENTQYLRGRVTDLRGRVAYIEGATTSTEIYVLSSEWECVLYDHRNSESQ
jgi:hypothetical protein